MEVPEDSVYPHKATEVRPLLVDGGGDGFRRGAAVQDVVVLGEVEYPPRCMKGTAATAATCGKTFEDFDTTTAAVFIFPSYFGREK